MDKITFDRVRCCCNYVPDKSVNAAPLQMRGLCRALGIPRIYEYASGSKRDLMRDAFMQLRDDSIEVVGKEDTSPSRFINRALIDWMKSEPWFKSNMSLPAAMAAAYMLVESLLQNDTIAMALCEQDKMPEPVQTPRPKYIGQNQEQDGQQDENQPNTAVEEEQDENTEPQQEPPQIDNKSQQALDDLLKKMEGMKNHPIMSAVMSQAVEKASEEGDKIDALIKSCGCEPASISPLDAPTIVEVARDMLTQDFSVILGGLRGVARQAIEDQVRTSATPQAKVDVTRDMLKLFPYERLSLSDEAPEVFRTPRRAEYIQNGLLGWKYVESPQEEGAVTIVLDESGSMDDVIGVAKAMVLSLIMELKQYSNRPFYVISFSNEAKVSLSDEDTSSKAMLQFAAHFENGGTNFDDALKLAIECTESLLEKSPDGGIPDILFITDGLSEIESESIKQIDKLRKEKGVRLMAILLNDGNIEGYKRRYWQAFTFLESADLYQELSQRDGLNDQGTVNRLTRTLSQAVVKFKQKETW